MTEKDAYALEQYVPLIARYRRLMPNDEKYEAKRMSSVLSFLGFRVRTNTSEEQETARYYQEKETGR